MSLSITSIEPASADASFRRYFRVNITAASAGELPTTLIAMDSPPEHEDNALFLQCTEVLARCKVHVPTIYAHELSLGFLLMSDLGTEVYQSALNQHSADNLYHDATQALLHIQQSGSESYSAHYSAQKLRDEMQLFDDWYIQQYHQSSLNSDEITALNNSMECLIQSALEQPQVLVHRDYHCRNLLVTTDNNPGIIDYQDMVIGPITYDLVSLFKDCYIQWPTADVKRWTLDFLQRSHEIGIHQHTEQEQWLQWFDWMGIQRHLKVLGIFSRLFYRDGKDQYLNDIPLTYHYLIDACEKYPELSGLSNILKQYPAKQP